MSTIVVYYLMIQSCNSCVVLCLVIVEMILIVSHIYMNLMYRLTVHSGLPRTLDMVDSQPKLTSPTCPEHWLFEGNRNLPFTPSAISSKPFRHEKARSWAWLPEAVYSACHMQLSEGFRWSSSSTDLATAVLGTSVHHRILAEFQMHLWYDPDDCTHSRSFTSQYNLGRWY